MARKYVRDNRGRFASTGATQRGAGLRTAAGNKRKSVKMAGPASKPAGAVKGRVKRDPGAAGKIGKAKPRSAATSGLRPGEVMNAVARPRNVTAKFQKGENPFHEFSVMDGRNASTAQKILESQGVKVVPWQTAYGRDANTPAVGWLGQKQISLNPKAWFWENPKKRAIAMRRAGRVSSSAPLYMVEHEKGHNQHPKKSTAVQLAATPRNRKKQESSTMDWGRAVGGSAGKLLKEGANAKVVARRVSEYATVNPREFVAEVYAGLRTGRKYDAEVMQLYRKAKGLSPQPPARRRSRLRKPRV